MQFPREPEGNRLRIHMPTVSWLQVAEVPSGGFVVRSGFVQYSPYRLRKYSRDGLCEICGRPPSGKPILLFDHCHRHGWVRGLICNWCNIQAGYVENDQSRRALSYFLQRFPEYRRNCPDCRAGEADPAV